MRPLRSFFERSPIVTAIAYTVVAVLPLYLTAALSVRLQDELGFGLSEFGIIVGTFFVTAALGSKLVGPALDRRGPDFGFRYSGILSALAATVSLTAVHWVMLLTGMAVAGLANAYGQVASNLVVATEVRADRTGRAFAAKQAAVPLGAMLAGLAVPWIGMTVTWRAPYLITAVVGLVMITAAPRFKSKSRQPQSQERHRVTPALAMFMLMAAIGGGLGNSLASFVTDAAVADGFTQSGGARLLTLGSLAAIVTRVVIGGVADRRQGNGVLEVSSLLGVAVVGLAVLGSSAGSDVLFVTGAILGFVGTWGWQGAMFYSVLKMISMPAATSTGAVAAGAYLGTVIMPPLVGVAAETLGYQIVFIGQAALAAVAIIAVWMSLRLATAETSSTDMQALNATE